MTSADRKFRFGFGKWFFSSLLEVHLGNGAVLCLENGENDECGLMGFPGTLWHVHGDGDLTFGGPWGRYIELDILNLLNGLRDGTVLICEHHSEGKLVDRWLTRNEYNDEFKYLPPGDSIIVRRANSRHAQEMTWEGSSILG
jgi:hypothetical protein